MTTYTQESNDIINEIASITKKNNVLLKDLIIKLANHIADGLRNRNPEALNLAKMYLKTGPGYSKESADPTNLKNISKILNAIKESHFPSVTRQWIINCLPPEFKETKVNKPKEFDIEGIPDAVLIDKGNDIIRKIKKLTNHGPAEPFKTKRSLDDVKKHDFELDLSNVLLDIIINLEDYAKLLKEEESKDPEKLKNLLEIDKELARRLRTVADNRHATDEAKYEAIMLVSSTFDSLNHSTEGETQILTRWELFDREKKCLKCYNELNQCRAEKCNCACHESVKHLTTKGLKWAREHNPHLQKLDKQLNHLNEWVDDICSYAKILLNNAHVNDLTTKTQRRNLMYNHIEKDKCEQCEFFLEDHPNFFDEKK